MAGLAQAIACARRSVVPSLRALDGAIVSSNDSANDNANDNANVSVDVERRYWCRR